MTQIESPEAFPYILISLQLQNENYEGVGTSIRNPLSSMILVQLLLLVAGLILTTLRCVCLMFLHPTLRVVWLRLNLLPFTPSVTHFL